MPLNGVTERASEATPTPHSPNSRRCRLPITIPFTVITGPITTYTSPAQAGCPPTASPHRHRGNPHLNRLLLHSRLSNKPLQSRQLQILP